MTLSSRKIIPVLVSIALAAVACSKGGGGAKAAGDAMGYLPKDSSLVIGINFEAIRGSKLFKEFQPKLDEAMAKEEGFKKLKDTCKLDVTSEVKSMLIALGKDPNDQTGAFVVVAGLNKSAANKCVDDLKAKGEKVERKDDGALTSYTVDGEPLWVWWAGDDMLVTSPGAKDSPDKLKALAGGGAKLKDNAEVMGMVGKASTSSMLWAAGAIPDMPEMGMIESQLGGKPSAMYFSIDVPEGLDAKGGFQFADDATAGKVKQNVDTQLAAAKGQPMVGAYLNGVKVEQSGKDVKIAATLSADDVKTLVSLAKMAGGF